MTADQRLYSTIASPFKTGRRLDVADDKRYLGVRDATILYRIIDRQHVRAAARNQNTQALHFRLVSKSLRILRYSSDQLDARSNP